MPRLGHCWACQPDFDFPIHYSQNRHDELSLDLLYAATDVFVIPSRQDNFPNTGLRGSPLLHPRGALRQRRLVDIVDHYIPGALAQPFDPRSLTAAIRWVLLGFRGCMGCSR